MITEWSERFRMPENEECRNWIISDEYSDEIAGYYGKLSLLDGEECYQIIDENFAIVHRRRNGLENRGVQDVSFFRPYCFGLLQEDNLEEIGVNRIRRISGFDYQGRGTILGFVDTGIDYSHSAFLLENGVSRVRTIWDQNFFGDETSLEPSRCEGFQKYFRGTSATCIIKNEIKY